MMLVFRAFAVSVLFIVLLLVLLLSFLFLSCGGGIPAEFYFSRLSDILFGVQVWFWPAFICGFCYAFFFTFFPQRFWKVPEKTPREIDCDADVRRQEEDLLQKKQKNNRNCQRMIFFQVCGVFCGLWMLGLSFLFSRL